MTTGLQQRMIKEHFWRLESRWGTQPERAAKCVICGELLLGWANAEPFSEPYERSKELAVEHIATEHPEVLDWYGLTHNN